MITDPINTCKEILRCYGAKEIFLFGSRAKGTATENSDVDLAVRGLKPSEYFIVLGQLISAVGGPVDLVMLDDDTPFAIHLRAKIERGWLTRVG